MWLFPSGQEMTMKIKVMHDKKARLPGAWNPMSTLNTEQCWLLKKNYLHAAVFSSRKKNLVTLKNIFGFSKSGKILSGKRAKNIKVEKQRSTEDNIYKSDKNGEHNSSKQKKDWKQI